jgi:hypothetical protein
MNTRIILTGILLLITATALTNCGSDTKITNTKEISVGQQLADLENAHQRGIITDGEYKKLKRALIKKNS